LASSNPELLI